MNHVVELLICSKIINKSKGIRSTVGKHGNVVVGKYNN